MTYDKEAFIAEVQSVLNKLSDMLIQKNDAYGDSALNPVRIFSKAATSEQILVRMDDKLSRLARGQAAGEDVIHDLLGYLVLYQICLKREANAVHNERSSLPSYHEMLDKFCTEFSIPGAPDFNQAIEYAKKKANNPGIRFNGSVTDLTTDIAYELTAEQGVKLKEELNRFLCHEVSKFKKPTVHNERCNCLCQQCRVDKTHNPDICGCPQT